MAREREFFTSARGRGKGTAAAAATEGEEGICAADAGELLDSFSNSSFRDAACCSLRGCFRLILEEDCRDPPAPTADPSLPAGTSRLGEGRGMEEEEEEISGDGSMPACDCGCTSSRTSAPLDEESRGAAWRDSIFDSIEKTSGKIQARRMRVRMRTNQRTLTPCMYTYCLLTCG